MPATMAMAGLVLGAIPGWLERRGGDPRVARAAALGAIAAVVLGLAPIISARISERSEPVGRGRDAFLTDATTAHVLEEVARRVNPTGHLNFMPPELLIFGEDRILEAFRGNPPDLIALTHKDTREYGVGFFGNGYGRDLYGWVDANYEPIALFGDPPLEPGSHFGVRLLERKPISR